MAISEISSDTFGACTSFGDVTVVAATDQGRRGNCFRINRTLGEVGVSGGTDRGTDRGTNYIGLSAQGLVPRWMLLALADARGSVYLSDCNGGNRAI